MFKALRLPFLLLVIMQPVSANDESPEALRARSKTVLAQLEGELKLPGLKEPVEVLRDRWGIAHIYAKNQDDLFFAQGFVAAQDRLFQLDLWRRIGLGETAEIFGEEAIEADRFARLMLYRGDMAAEWASYAPDTQAIATSFAAGINACIDSLGEKLPIEFQVLGYRPKKWRPEDVLARMSGIIMSGNWQREIARAQLVAKVGLEQARRLSPTDPARDWAPDPDLDLSAITLDINRGYAAATRVLKFSPIPTESNNWVIDGTLSASGKPMLASDPHRALALPSLRYLVHLHAPGWNVIGSGEPALPGVALGHNERIAWGFTIVGTDQADLYVEQTNPADPRQYKVGDRWEPTRVVREKLRVRGRGEVPLELRFTRHGPVIHQDEKRNVAIALKWAGSEPGGAAYLASLSVARARNRQEFLAAMARWRIPSLNFVYADVDGDVGWVAAGAMPVRKSWDGLVPVPGAAGKYEWQGYLPVRELPQSFQPQSHWLATANHNILPEGYQHQVAYDWAAPHRFLRIKERLTASRKLTLEDLQSIQHEATSLPAQALIAMLKKVDVPADLSPYARLLTRWDGVLSRETAAGALYAVWLQELQAALFNPRMPPELRTDRLDLRSITVLLNQLTEPEAAWFGAEPVGARDELVRGALAKAVARTKKLLGDDPARWNWGRLHTAPFAHPLASMGPAYAKAFSLTPVARPGDVSTPNNTRHDDDFRQVHGASYRHVLDLADWDRGWATSTPGQSGQPGSPHYDDLLPLWAEGRYFPLAYSREKVESVARHRLQLRP
jgi:penicillin amidase